MNALRIVLLVVLAGCGLGAAVMWRGEARLEAENAQLKADNAKLAADAAAATEKARNLEAESAQLRAARAISGVRLAPAPAPARPEEEPSAKAGFIAKMFRNPEMRKMLATQQTAALRGIYSDYLKEANLTPDETDRFFQLLQDRQMALMDSSANAMSGGAVDLKSAAAVVNATNDALKELLGPARFGQYQEFEQTLGPRVQVQQFNQQLAAAGYPLQDFQRRALIDIMGQEAAAMPRGAGGTRTAQDMSAAAIDQYAQQAQAVNQRIYNRAMSVLTAPQLSAFAIYQKNIAASQAAGLKVAQQMLRGE